MTTTRATLHDELPSLEYIAKKVRPQMAQWKLMGITNLAECLAQKIDFPEKEKSKYPYFEDRIWVDEANEPNDLNTFSLIRLVDAQDLASDSEKTHNAKVKLNSYIDCFKKEIASTPEENLSEIFLDGRGVLGSGDTKRTIDCRVPILQSARYVQAVFSAPSDDCIKGLFFASFAVVKELYVVCPPGWTMGSARANDKSPPTAFVTGECAKARGYITRSFELTAELLQLYFEFVNKVHDLTELVFAPREWRDTELKRLCKSYSHTIAMKSKRSLLTPDLSALDLEKRFPNGDVDPKLVLTDALESFANSIIKFNKKIELVYNTEIELLRQRYGQIKPKGNSGLQSPGSNSSDIDISESNAQKQQSSKTDFDAQSDGTDDKIGLLLSSTTMEQQLDTSNGDLEEEKKQIQDKITFELSLAQVEYAMKTLLTKLTESGNAFTGLGKQGNYATASEVIKSASMAFQEQATYMKKLLEPTERYLRSVIERELSAKDKPSARFGELVCAAACLSEIDPYKYRDDILKAADYAIERISTRGLSRSNALIISADEQGNSYVVPATEIVRAFTQLVANMGLQISPDIIDKIIDYFKSISLCKAFPKDGSVPLDIGWFHDFPVYPEKVNRYTTALALLALNRLCRMIDNYVNSRVLSYFRVRHPRAIETSLDDCVYSDFGLASLPQGFRSCYDSNPEAFGKSVALILEDMRSGVSRLANSESVCSMILFGPPGTGKSTLPKALAKSADVPFVEITPGDLLVEGEPLVEMRSEDVFKALSFLRRCVVLFDEFDQIIQRRSNTTNSNIFSFTTSTNLTRFADLRESFKDNHSVFILSTNRISQLDDAAIRKGRFDVKMGIYHPDLISVAGYVALCLHKSSHKTVNWPGLKKLLSGWGDENLSVLSAKSRGNFRSWQTDPKNAKYGTLQYSYENNQEIAKTLFTSDKPFEVSETSNSGRQIGENEKRQFEILKLIKVHFEEQTRAGKALENLNSCEYWINAPIELTQPTQPSVDELSRFVFDVY